MHYEGYEWKDDCKDDCIDDCIDVIVILFPYRPNFFAYHSSVSSYCMVISIMASDIESITNSAGTTYTLPTADHTPSLVSALDYY